MKNMKEISGLIEAITAKGMTVVEATEFIKNSGAKQEKPVKHTVEFVEPVLKPLKLNIKKPKKK